MICSNGVKLVSCVGLKHVFNPTSIDLACGLTRNQGLSFFQFDHIVVLSRAPDLAIDPYSASVISWGALVKHGCGEDGGCGVAGYSRWVQHVLWRLFILGDAETGMLGTPWKFGDMRTSAADRACNNNMAMYPDFRQNFCVKFERSLHFKKNCK